MLSDIWGGVVSAAQAVGSLFDSGGGQAASGLTGVAAESGGGWGGAISGLGSLARVATPLVGAYLGTEANADAARLQAGATRDATLLQAAALQRTQQMQREAADRGIAAIRAGTTRYADTIAPMMVERPVMLPTYRGLTEAEGIARDDIRRNSVATLASSGLRGAGRAGVAAVMDADRRFVTSATDRNDDRRIQAMQQARTSADSARRGLAGVYAQEGSAIANTEIGQGNRIADTEGTIGGVQAQGAISQGQIGAGQATADASLWGDALGTLGAVIADAGKSANRDRYSTNDRWV
jgi:hypothetical protein